MARTVEDCGLVIRLANGASVPEKMYKGTSLWRWYKYSYVFAFNPRQTSVEHTHLRLAEHSSPPSRFLR